MKKMKKYIRKTMKTGNFKLAVVQSGILVVKRSKETMEKRKENKRATRLNC